MSDWDDRSSASPGLKLTVACVLAVGVGALAFTWYTYQHQHSLVQAEHDARVADEVARLQHELNALRGRDSSLTRGVQALQTKQGTSRRSPSAS